MYDREATTLKIAFDEELERIKETLQNEPAIREMIQAEFEAKVRSKVLAEMRKLK